MAWTLEDEYIFRRVTGTTYLLMAVTGLGYLALMWSTVVLLGGFVTLLHKKDFWCVTVISMTQAARIFNDLAEQLAPNFVSVLVGNIVIVSTDLCIFSRQFARGLRRRPAAMSTWFWALQVLDRIIIIPFNGMGYVAACLYQYSGPFVCIALAMWRIAQRDYTGGDSSSGGGGTGNLVPALDMFYSLVLFQGGLYVIWPLWEWGIFDDDPASLLREYRGDIGLPDEEWCCDYLARYLSDIRARCWREPASIRERTLRHFALDSLDSGSWEDMLSGLRFLDAMVEYGEDMRPQLLPFRPRIQKLIDVLGWRHPADRAREMRVAAASIVAQLAPDIHLAQFPGAMECISSLLLDEEATDLLLTNIRTRDSYKLILRGLAILDGLAFDHNNCTAICSTPGGLLRTIMAPLSSAHLMDDIRNNTNWARVVSRSLKVLYKLLLAPGMASSQLRREIYSNKQSMSNLESFLEHGQEYAGWELAELKREAMGILTQLRGDVSINLAMETKKKLITKLLQIFLGDGEEGEEAATVFNPLTAWAGETLLSLLTKNKSDTALVMNSQNDIIGRLAGILDAKNATTYRIIAANILENLCAHCDLDKQWVKETLLPKVVTEILSSKRGPPENNVSPPSDEANQKVDSPPGDQENQQNSAPRRDEETNNISTQQDHIEIQETSPTTDQYKSSDGGNKQQSSTTKLTREAFLSLALVILDKLVSPDDFDNAVQKEGVGPAAFVGKIKTIVEDNYQGNAESLRIVKLCCRIAEPMMQRDQYAQHFRNTGFVELVSNASKNMSNLESCMLLAETDFGLKNTLRPTLSDLKNRAIHLDG
ncbi:unnamed protein product [Urochloa decumbens]|uniref:Uncharacterized protein n=1 Tax=Urochloa decumbens TaxID=240449 RepID=A0ABC8VYM5_9POAL